MTVKSIVVLLGRPANVSCIPLLPLGLQNGLTTGFSKQGFVDKVLCVFCSRVKLTRL